ncbi:MAG: hypothetical protein J2P41_00720 [Blastocatellia bacterium]|nr:hypothetical protein [Blastocatellia bacterium]
MREKIGFDAIIKEAKKKAPAAVDDADLDQKAAAVNGKAVKTPTRKPVKRKAVNTELRNNGTTSPRKNGKRETIKWTDTSSLVTVGTKAPADVAQHWVVEAKRQGLSMTYIITKALIEAFGAPEGAVLEDEE